MAITFLKACSSALDIAPTALYHTHRFAHWIKPDWFKEPAKPKGFGEQIVDGLGSAAKKVGDTAADAIRIGNQHFVTAASVLNQHAVNGVGVLNKHAENMVGVVNQHLGNLVKEVGAAGGRFANKVFQEGEKAAAVLHQNLVTGAMHGKQAIVHAYKDCRLASFHVINLTGSLATLIVSQMLKNSQVSTYANLSQTNPNIIKIVGGPNVYLYDAITFVASACLVCSLVCLTLDTYKSKIQIESNIPANPLALPPSEGLNRGADPVLPVPAPLTESLNRPAELPIPAVVPSHQEVSRVADPVLPVPAPFPNRLDRRANNRHKMGSRLMPNSPATPSPEELNRRILVEEAEMFRRQLEERVIEFKHIYPENLDIIALVIPLQELGEGYCVIENNVKGIRRGIELYQLALSILASINKKLQLKANISFVKSLSIAMYDNLPELDRMLEPFDQKEILTIEERSKEKKDPSNVIVRWRAFDQRNILDGKLRAFPNDFGVETLIGPLKNLGDAWYKVENYTRAKAFYLMAIEKINRIPNSGVNTERQKLVVPQAELAAIKNQLLRYEMVLTIQVNVKGSDSNCMLELKAVQKIKRERFS